MWKWSLAAVWPRRGLRRINSAVPLRLRQKKKKKKRLLGKSYKKFMRKPEGAYITLWRAHSFAVFDQRHGTGTVGESTSNWYHMPRCDLWDLLFVQPCMFLSSGPSYKPLNAHKENTEQRVPRRTSPRLIDPVWKRGVWQTNGPPFVWCTSIRHSITACWEVTAGFNWPVTQLTDHPRWNSHVWKSLIVYIIGNGSHFFFQGLHVMYLHFAHSSTSPLMVEGTVCGSFVNSLENESTTRPQ